MGKYVIRRLLLIIPVFLGVTLATFLLMRALPGDPFTSEKKVPEAQMALIREKYGLNKPIYEAYFIYIWNFIRFDWGYSLNNRNIEVKNFIGEHVGYSIQLGLLAFAFMILIGIPLGIIAALQHNKLPDYLATGVSLFFFSIPSFVLAILVLVLIVVANASFGWNLPVTKTSPGLLDLIIPGLVLGIRPASIITRLTRASMLEVLGQDYVRTAWSKGLSQRLLIVRHALKNALIPIVTVLGDYLGFLVVGSVTIEAVFAIPGIGQYYVRSIVDRDYPLIMITTIIYAMVAVFINLAVDLIYGLLDPRIKYTTRKVVS